MAAQDEAVSGNKKIKVAIIGSGNIGTDLMIKILRTSKLLEISALAGIDPASDGLKRAERFGIVFDATSAAAHAANSRACAADGKVTIDLTPAAVGPYVVPVINGEDNLE